MNNDLIDRLSKLTGSSTDTIDNILDGLSMNDMYDLIDLSNSDASDASSQLLKWFDDHKTDNKVEEATKVPTVPKPRDPMAKALALPQYQPKSTPSKRGILDKSDNKHKGRRDDFVRESVMSMTSMPAIQRLLELAGQPSEYDDVVQAMGDLFDFSKYGVDTTIVGDEIPTGEIEFPDFNDEPQVEVTDDLSNVDDDLDDITTIDDPLASVNDNCSEAYDAIASAVDCIQTQLGDIKVTEFQLVKEMINGLNSAIDQIGNGVK